ncbi:MAG: [ribosomal protein S18]-alanine N-acetyltransferase [Frankiales bacterium]|jgi:ribosomal-protein-alanine N-acetyltransferase|nr:[ribosomal protein S18]-alanine N-acetyltransferase [Frankiales bacterium]
MTVTLVPMRWWHIGKLLPLEAELFPEEQWSETMFWSELAQDSRLYLVAERTDDDGSVEVVGYAGLCCYVGEAYIQTIGVIQQAQGTGIGGLLLTALLEECVRRGEDVVTLEVRADNPTAQAVYERFGFLPIGLRRRYYQPSGVDAIVMQMTDVAGHLAARAAAKADV